jgi:hypothetical protein
MEVKNAMQKRILLTIGYGNEAEPAFVKNLNPGDKVEVSILFDRIVINEV